MDEKILQEWRDWARKWGSVTRKTGSEIAKGMKRLNDER